MRPRPCLWRTRPAVVGWSARTVGCSAVEVHVHGGGASVLPLVRLRVEFAVGVHDAEDDAGDVLALGEVLRLLSEVAFDDVGGLDGGHGVLLWLVGIAP